MQIQPIPIQNIIPNPEQPRTEFDPEALDRLAQSIKENGLIQPITVEATSDPEVFILEDGERRWRAFQIAGLKTITAVVKPVRSGNKDQARLVAAFLANFQREDMNPIDEARVFHRLINGFGWSLTKAAHRLGTSYPTIKARLLLLKLDEPIQELIAGGRLHKDPRAVQAILDIPDQEARIKFARHMAHKGVTVSLILSGSKKLIRKLEGIEDKPNGKPPAEYYAGKKCGPRNAPIYDQLAAKDRLPHWALVTAAAEQTCKACAFFDEPSQEICGECPAVYMVVSLVEISLKERRDERVR